MSWIAAAVIGSNIVGGLISSNGQQEAANTHANAQQQAAATQQHMFDTINQQEQPFIQSGYGATTALNQLLGLAPGNPATGQANGYLAQSFNPTQEQLNNYPGYQFALQTGGQALRNADTPGIGALSGAALKDLMNFNVGTANQYYGQYFNQDQQQKNNLFSRLSGLAGLGQNAETNVGTQGTALGTGIAQAQAAAGGSLAAGQVGAANTLGNSISGSVPLAYLMSGNGGGYGALPGTVAAANASSDPLGGLIAGNANNWGVTYAPGG